MTAKLISIASSLPTLPTWTEEKIIRSWFQEYEHGVADAEDIAEELSLRKLSFFTEKLLRHLAANFQISSSLQEVKEGLDVQIESNEVKLGSFQEEILSDLFLTLLS